MPSNYALPLGAIVTPSDPPRDETIIGIVLDHLLDTHNGRTESIKVAWISDLRGAFVTYEQLDDLHPASLHDRGRICDLTIGHVALSNAIDDLPAEQAPRIRKVDPELDRLLAEEEEIERRHRPNTNWHAKPEFLDEPRPPWEL